MKQLAMSRVVPQPAGSRDRDRDLEDIGRDLSSNFTYGMRAGFFLRKWTRHGYTPKGRLARELYLHVSQLLDSAKNQGKTTYQISQVTLGHKLGASPKSIGRAVRELTLGPVPLLKVEVGRIGRAQSFTFVENPGVWRRMMDAAAARTQPDRHERAVREQAAAQSDFADNPAALARETRAITNRQSYRQPLPSPVSPPRAQVPPATSQPMQPATLRAVSPAPAAGRAVQPSDGQPYGRLSEAIGAKPLNGATVSLKTKQHLKRLAGIQSEYESSHRQAG